MFHQILFLASFLPKLSLCYQWGSFDVLEGHTLAPDTAFQQSIVTSQCTCRSVCLNDSNCHSFGVELQSPFRYSCRLFNNTVNMTLSSSPNGLVGGPYIDGASLEKDGFYYFFAPKTTNFSVIEPSCNVTLGNNVQFRLALIKTNASFDVFSSYNSKEPTHVAIGLVKNMPPNDTRATFLDGTPFEDSEIGKSKKLTNEEGYPTYYTMLQETFNDLSSGWSPFYPLCQGNPLKLKI